MSQAVVGIVPGVPEANLIVDSLRVAGFANSEISILLPDRTSCGLGYEKHSKAPEGISAGAGTGALLGGALGWLAGVGSLAIPGAGPFIAAGPIMAGLGGAAIGGALGGVSGGLVGLGIPEYEAKQYEGRIKEGNILLSVHAVNDDELRVAEKIFNDCGAKEIHCIREKNAA